jgi:uncharacterized protein YjbJ (UPF0337 family)
MGYDDKLGNKVEEMKGDAKEKFGDATGNESLANEGRGDQLSANTKQAGEHVKDAARDVKDAFSKD